MGLPPVAQVGAAAAFKPSKLEIDLREQVQLEQRYYTLADIAVLRGTDQALVKRLERVRLGRTPRAGYSAEIDQQQIARRLDRVIPGISQHIAWPGARSATLGSTKVAYSKDRYVAVAQRYLSGQLEKRFIDHSVRPTGDYRALILPPGEVQLTPSLCSVDKVRKRSCVWIDVSVDGEHYRTLPVWFDVSVFANVLELKRELPAGAVVHPQWVRTRLRDVANVPGSPLQSLDQISDRRATRALSDGAILTIENFEPLPPVVKGQQVTVQSSVGNITLTARARALEDGYAGEAIRLERLDGAASYVAVVIDDGLVSVRGGRYE